MADNANDKSNGSAVINDVTIDSVETHVDNAVMPRAHGINQVNKSASTSAPGFTPRGNPEAGANNLNNKNNPALGQRRMSNNDLRKSGLDDNKGIDKDKNPKHLHNSFQNQ